MADNNNQSGTRIITGSTSTSSSFFFSIFALFLLLLFLFSSVVLNFSSSEWSGNLSGSKEQHVEWREKLTLRQLKYFFSKEDNNTIVTNTKDLGTLNLDSLKTNNESSPKVIDLANFSDIFLEPEEREANSDIDLSEGQQHDTLPDGHTDMLDSLAVQNRKWLREKTSEKHIPDLIKQDDGTVVKLENAAVLKSKPVDSALLGKYNIWRWENENEKNDTTVRLIRDQIIMARVYISIAQMKNRSDLLQELDDQLKESRHALGDATNDADLSRSARKKIKIMGQVLSKAKEELYDWKLVTEKLRSMLQTAEEQVRDLKKQSIFLSQLVAKTIPNEIHCLAMRLTIDYHLLPYEKRKFPKGENLDNPNLYHYALFSDNVLATSVVVNSTVMNAKEPEKHVFHLVTDKLNFGAMNMWFLLNPPGNATIIVENVDEFKWLNSSYCPVLRQLESSAMKEYYFKTDHFTPGTSNLKYRNPKYMSMLNHLRFYLPQIYPKLDKILFLDDDIVVQKDLTPLWSVDLDGNVNGAVETCGVSFHRFDKYLNFSNPHISSNFDPSACGWAYGMNLFDLKEWKKRDITGLYHKWQNMNENRTLWNLGTLPPGLITFYGLTHALDKTWHVLGLGYNPGVNTTEIDNAAVIHYNGNMKPWLEIAMAKYRGYWTKYINYNHPYISACKLSA